MAAVQLRLDEVQRSLDYAFCQGFSRCAALLNAETLAALVVFLAMLEKPRRAAGSLAGWAGSEHDPCRAPKGVRASIFAALTWLTPDPAMMVIRPAAISWARAMSSSPSIAVSARPEVRIVSNPSAMAA